MGIYGLKRMNFPPKCYFLTHFFHSNSTAKVKNLRKIWKKCCILLTNYGQRQSLSFTTDKSKIWVYKTWFSKVHYRVNSHFPTFFSANDLCYFPCSKFLLFALPWKSIFVYFMFRALFLSLGINSKHWIIKFGRVAWWVVTWISLDPLTRTQGYQPSFLPGCSAFTGMADPDWLNSQWTKASQYLIGRVQPSLGFPHCDVGCGGI